MRAASVVLVLAVSGLAAFGAAPTGSLSPLADEAAERRAAIGSPESRAERREVRALAQIEAAAAPGTADLVGELLSARRAGRVVERRFRRDAEFPPLLGAAVDALAAAADAERGRLALWSHRLGTRDAEDRLARGLRLCDRSLAQAQNRAKQSSRARSLARGCQEIDRTRTVLALAGDPPPLVPDAMPDFAAEDVNPASPSFRSEVSPRDYLGKFSAWYFGHSG